MMSAKAKALQTLYRRGKVTVEGLRKAMHDGVITTDEFLIIVGDDLPNEPQSL